MNLSLKLTNKCFTKRAYNKVFTVYIAANFQLFQLYVSKCFVEKQTKVNFLGLNKILPYLHHVKNRLNLDHLQLSFCLKERDFLITLASDCFIKELERSTIQLGLFP